MRKIAQIVDWIDDEIDGSEQYAHAAMQAKEANDMESSRAYCDMARQELAHADMLHDMVVREIRKAEQDDVEVPKGMMEIWEWKHDKYIDRVAKARIMLDMCQQ